MLSKVVFRIRFFFFFSKTNREETKQVTVSSPDTNTSFHHGLPFGPWSTFCPGEDPRHGDEAVFALNIFSPSLEFPKSNFIVLHISQAHFKNAALRWSDVILVP